MKSILALSPGSPKGEGGYRGLAEPSTGTSLPYCWMNGIVFKVRENSKVINKPVSIAVGLRRDKKKEVLGLWLGTNESAAFWMSVLTDMKSRGTEDILITATDNLNGFTNTIRNVFPNSKAQIFVVHQIRNARRYVV